MDNNIDMNDISARWRKGLVFTLMVIIGLMVVLGRCWYLQYYKKDFYREKAAKQQLRVITQAARRGTIVDRKGKLLAVSVKVPSIWIDPTFVVDIKQAAKDLAKVLGIDEAELYQEMKERADQKRKFMRIKHEITEKHAQQVRDMAIRGVMVEETYRRKYPKGTLAAHIIGYTTVNGEGLEGIEAKFDEYLVCHPGRWRLASDSKRRIIGAKEGWLPAEDGKTVVLTIDSVIQEQAEIELEKAVKKFKAKSGTAIVMDPKSGEVIALANYPSFDLNNARQIGPALKRNQALTDPYEPGSTFKPLTVAAGIQGGFVQIDQKIDCLKKPYVGKGFGRIREYKNYHGLISVAKIIIKSSNIGVAKIAQKMGDDYFYDMIEKFGFGRKTGIDLPGEGVGLPHQRVRDDGTLYTLPQQLKAKYGPGYTLTRVAYGQGISVTPIQLIRGFCVLANGGRLVKPRVVNGVVHHGKVVKSYNKYPLPGTYKLEGAAWNTAGMVVSNEVSRQVIEKALVNVVKQQGGTAHRHARLEKWQVFGKTGTANIPRKDGKGYEDKKWNSSFIAGAPAADPKLCVLVTIREPDSSLNLGYTGGVVAGPVVREILRHALTYMRVPGDLEESEE